MHAPRSAGTYFRIASGLVLATTWIALSPTTVRALINPNYTPVDLVRQAGAILRLELTLTVAEDKTLQAVRAEVAQVLKGKAPATVTLHAGGVEGRLAKDPGLATAGGKTASALMFLGDFAGASMQGQGLDAPGATDQPSGDDAPVGVLHVGTRWFSLLKAGGDGFRLAPDPFDLKTVWAGGNEMLQRVIEYVLTDPRAEVPVAVGATWAECDKLATIEGQVHGCLAVDLDGAGALSLLVMAERGDRVFRWKAGGSGFEEITPKLKLTTNSRCAACGDFDGDGRLDLVSSDGRKITVCLRSADGTFAAGKLDVPLPDGCSGLAVLDVGMQAKAGVLISPGRGDGGQLHAPILLRPDRHGAFTANRLSEEGLPAAHEFGAAGPCAVGDFDNDGLPEVVQPFGGGAVFYRATELGKFAPPEVACKAFTGKDLTAAFTADYDADGKLDVVVTSDAGFSLLGNLGSGKFRQAKHEAGSAAYISKPAVAGGAMCDLNNDGRQDLMLLYGNNVPQPFFNRGFRCFGYAIDMGMERSTLPAAESLAKGQQAGTVADLDGDGGQDAVFVSTGGEVWVLWREVEQSPRLGLRVALPPAANTPGPVAVTAFNGTRCLGVQSVVPGGQAFFGRRNKGPLALSWQLPGGKPQTKQVIVLKPTRLELPDSPAAGS